jgi:RNA-binding protein 39
MLANERDVYQYFTKANVGKIRDVRLIRDQRSGKSKGYVKREFVIHFIIKHHI